MHKQPIKLGIKGPLQAGCQEAHHPGLLLTALLVAAHQQLVHQGNLLHMHTQSDCLHALQSLLSI